MQSRVVERDLKQEELSNSYGRLDTIPYRIGQLEKGLLLINRFGLPRSHRHIFLLIDGQRTTTELAHLIGCRLDEVQNILSDLEKAGVIHQQQIKFLLKGW
jgi:hypothetical protein